MSEKPDFMTLVLNGQVLSSEIDDFVDQWHGSNSEVPLYQFLGMSFKEYSLWASDDSTLDIVIAARHKGTPLERAVNDNIQSAERLAARAGDAGRIARLKRWIEAQPDR